MKNRYKAEVIGSLLRPDYLSEAREKWENGQLSVLDFKKVEDRAVREVINLQEEAGVDVVTDGEMRRYTFTGPLSEVIGGIEMIPGITFHWYGKTPEEDLEYQNRSSITGKLERKRSLAIEEFVYARAISKLPVKITLPSPLVMTNWWNPELTPKVYKDPFEMYKDAADIIVQEVEDLIQLGCEYIQIDAPELATLVDKRQWKFYEGIGANPERLLKEGVELLNSIPRGENVTFGIHLCRGNNAGRWMSEGGYEHISREVFANADNYDVFLLEYDDERSGGFEPLSDVPDDKTVVLGLISSKKKELEEIGMLEDRVTEAGKYIPVENLAISTQCGFASAAYGNPIEVSTEKQKLGLVSRVAKEILR